MKSKTTKEPKLLRKSKVEMNEANEKSEELARDLWNVMAERGVDNYEAFQTAQILFRIVGLLTYGREITMMYLQAMIDDLDEAEGLDGTVKYYSEKLMKGDSK